MSMPDFSGPFGGALAASFMSGCIAGYTFAKARINALVKKVDVMETQHLEKIEEITSKYELKVEGVRKKFEKILKEKEDKCEEKIEALERRMVQLEESRLQIALESKNAED